MLTVTADYTHHDDAELAARVRAGTVAAFGPLYERHIGAATRRARTLARGRAEADALVSDGFTRLLEILLAGGGPTQSVRAYLLTTITRLAYTRSRQEQREQPMEDPPADIDDLTGQMSLQDSALQARLDQALAVRAYERLSPTAQQVLWYTEVLAMSPARAAPLLRIRANAVSARAHRAWDELRIAYLAAHVDRTRCAPRCTSIVDRLSRWTRKAVCHSRRRVEQHLDGCPSCRSLAAELAAVNATLPPSHPRPSDSSLDADAVAAERISTDED
ncbi:RNA polymerase sigma factor [Lentzea alba]|uniref:sigma factor n=1 Tax=Lentzea alba TaxID=2714351 RepID=UPI0039BF7E8C